jgi:hypothetical protein
LFAASHSAELKTNVASGNSDMPLAWSAWRWVITTAFTEPGSMPRSLSWLWTAWSGSISRPLKKAEFSRPKFACGLSTTEGCSPVSMRIGPATGCSTQKHTIGMSTDSVPTPIARSAASGPDCL